MTREQLDADTINTSIGAGATGVVEVEVSRGEDVAVLVDSGSTDGDPASYDLEARSYNSEFADYQVYEQITGSTAHSHEFNAIGETMQFEFTNQSGASATYRVLAKSHREMD